MAITTLNNRVSYAGDDASTVFSFPNKFILDADLVVIIRDALDVETVQTITTHYTVAGAGVDAGGTVTMITPPATGETLIIYRDPSPTQELDLRENDSAPAEAQETAYDKLTMLVQRLIDIDERTISLSDGFTDTFDLTLPSELTADTVIGVNAGGTALEMKTGDDLMSLAGALLIANDLSDLNSVSTALVNLGINLYDSRITTNASGVSTNVTDIDALETTLSGGTGAVVWTTLAQTLSNKTFSDPIMAADGTSSLPSYTFSADLNTGMYRSTTDTLELVGGGFAALQVKKSTGSFANIGMGGNASVSDSFPLLIERNIAAGMTIQASNPNGGASAASKIVLKAGIGSVDTGEIALWPTAQTLHAYQNRLVVRSSDSAAGISLVGSGSGADDVRIYNGGVAATNENIRFNADYSMQIMQEIATPASPSANTHKLYAKADGKLYRLDSGGAEKELGAGTGSGSGINYAINQDFETNSDDVTVTANITKALEVTAKLRGSQSLKLTIDTLATTADYVDFDLNTFDDQDSDESKAIVISFDINSSNANYTSDDVEFVLRDVTNSIDIPISNDDDGLIKSFNGNYKFVGVAQSVAGIKTYKLRMNVLVAPSTDSILYIDTIKVGPDTFGTGYIGTDPQTYTPTFTGLGTVTGVEVSHWRDGKFLKIRGRVTAGTPTATEARVSFPNSLVSDPVALPNIQKVGMTGYSPSFARTLFTMGEPSVSYFTFSVQSGGVFNKLDGSALLSASEILTFDAEIPIENWSSGNLISTQEANYLVAEVRGEGNAATVLTASVTDIDFAETSDKHNLWDGDSFTAPMDMTVGIEGSIRTTGSAATAVFAYIDGTRDKVLGNYPSTSVFGISGAVRLAKGEVLTIRMNQSLTLSDDTDHHYIVITAKPKFKTFGAYKNEEYFAESSSTHTPTATNTYYQMTGNSLALTPGTHKLPSTLIDFGNNGTTPTYTFVQAAWYAANGANNSTVPAALTTVTGLSILSATDSTHAGWVSNQLSAGNARINTQEIVITLSQDATIYLVPHSFQTTSANGRVITYQNAERIK